MNTPLVSVIVPYQNRADEDRRLMLDALLGGLPDRADLEILLVDDHSTLPYSPGPSFAHLQLRQLALPPGQTHPGPARNLAITAARGHWIAFVDSDDLLDPSGLARLMDGIGQGRWDDADLLILRAFSFWHDDPDKEAERHLYVNRWIDRAETEPAALVRVPACWVRVVRKSFLQKADIRFGSTMVAEDVTFAVDLALARPRMAFAGFALARVRAGHGSLSARMSAPSLVDALTVKLAANARLRSSDAAVWEYPLLLDLIALCREDWRLGLAWLPRLIGQRARWLPPLADLWLALRSRV